MKKTFPRFWLTAVVALFGLGLFLLALGGYLAPILQSAGSPIVAAQRWISSRYLAVYEFVTVPRDVATLRAENAQLKSEVAGLQTQVIELQQQINEAQVLYALLDFARARPSNKYAAATVIGRDPSPFMHYVYIDQGSDEGLRYGMPVVTDQGIVGQVDAVTAQGARVQLITDPASVVNVRLQSLQVDAQLSGSITGDLTLNMVAPDVNLQPGELVLTSGLGGSYPANILVGQVVSVRRLEGTLFQTATVQSAVDFRGLQAVLVITNFKPVELGPLEPDTNP